MSGNRTDESHDKKRRFPRAASVNTLLVTAVDGEPLDEFLKTHSVGRGGCGFDCPQELAVGSTLDLMIGLRPVAFQVIARVVYCRPSDDGFEVGCEFLDLGVPEQRLIDAVVAAHRRDAASAERGASARL